MLSHLVIWTKFEIDFEGEKKKKKKFEKKKKKKKKKK